MFFVDHAGFDERSGDLYDLMSSVGETMQPLVDLGSCRSVLKSGWISKCFKVVIQWAQLRQLCWILRSWI